MILMPSSGRGLGRPDVALVALVVVADPTLLVAVLAAATTTEGVNAVLGRR